MNDGFYSSYFGNGPNFSFDKDEQSGAKKTFSRLFLALSVYLLIATLMINGLAVTLILISENAYNSVFGSEIWSSVIGAVVQYGIALPIFWLLVRRIDVTSPRTYSIGAKEMLTFFCISYVFMLLGSYIGTVYSSVVDSLIGTESVNRVNESIESSPLWVTFIFAVILAPIFEELLMRKLFIDRLMKYGTGFAITVSAAAFGIFHGNFYQLFYAVLSGFVLGFVYVRGGLKYSVALHMLINFWGSVASYTFTYASGMLDGNEDFSLTLVLCLLAVIVYSILTVTILAVGIRGIIRAVREMSHTPLPFDEPIVKIPRGKLMNALFANFGTVFFLCLSCLLIFIGLF